MDKIQKFLVTAGRKDLAQEYYEKIAGDKFTEQDFKNVSFKSYSSGASEWYFDTEDTVEPKGVDSSMKILNDAVSKFTKIFNLKLKNLIENKGESKDKFIKKAKEVFNELRAIGMNMENDKLSVDEQKFVEELEEGFENSGISYQKVDLR